MALTADRFVRFDVLDAVVPFLSSYRPVAVGLGVLAAHAALAVHASFALRRRIGVKVWRALHFLSFFAFAAALVHGLSAGTDSELPPVRAMYLAAGVAVGGLVLLRVATSRRTASSAASRSAPGTSG
jgi:sulfoxide reductase heme-binding subunit YedZ